MPVSWGGIAGEQLGRLERSQRRQAGGAQNWDAYQFKVSPTCPPSTSVYFRGGLCWFPSAFASAHGWFVNNYTVDLSDTDLTTTSTSLTYHSYIFTNANWYAGCVVVLRFGLNPDTYDLYPSPLPDQSIVLAGTLAGTADAIEEFATAAEAENALQTMSVERANSAGLPMAALVLRNNGNTTDPNQWMAIDRVNRGRSYLLWDYRQAWEIG